MAGVYAARTVSDARRRDHANHRTTVNLLTIFENDTIVERTLFITKIVRNVSHQRKENINKFLGDTEFRSTGSVRVVDVPALTGKEKLRSFGIGTRRNLTGGVTRKLAKQSGIPSRLEHTPVVLSHALAIRTGRLASETERRFLTVHHA